MAAPPMMAAGSDLKRSNTHGTSNRKLTGVNPNYTRPAKTGKKDFFFMNGQDVHNFLQVQDHKCSYGLARRFCENVAKLVNDAYLIGEYDMFKDNDVRRTNSKEIGAFCRAGKVIVAYRYEQISKFPAA